MADVNIKASITVDASNAEKGIKQVNDGIKGASSNAKSSTQDFGKLKDTMGQLGPAGEAATKQMGSLNQAFNLLKANPIIAVFALIAGLVYALFQKFKEMEAVSDALGKAFGTLSSIISTFVNAVLTPLIDGFVKIVEVTTNGLVKALDFLGITSKETADRTGQLIDQLDNLEDAERDSALATAESNRKLQEAREIAADANVPIKDRIAALREAANIERQESLKVVEINRQKAAAMFEIYAQEHGAQQKTIDLIRQGTLESLKAARTDLMTQKNANMDKIAEITKLIIAAENESASLSKISKRTESQITGLEKEEQSKREAQRKAAEERRQKQQAEINAKRKKEEEDLMKEFERISNIKIKSEEVKAVDLTNLTTAPIIAQVDAQMAATAQINKAAEQEAANKKFWADETARIQKEKQDQQIAGLQAIGDATNALGDIVGKQTVAGKALATAQALINTYTGITEIWRNRTVLPEPFGTIQKVASTVVAAASGFAAVKNIIRVNVPGGGGGGGAAPSMSAAAPVTPEVQTTSLTPATIQNIGNAAAGGVNRAYILDSDVRNSNERQARLYRAARLA